MTAKARSAPAPQPDAAATSPESQTMEALRRENERLRGDLLTISRRICHDLRSPIGGILTAGELATEMLAEGDASRAELTRPIFRSIESLTKLIERISLITQASARPLAKSRISMKDVFWRARQRFEPQIFQRGVKVTEPDTWPEVEGVESWIEAIWGNLLANALQHAGEPAQIELGWIKHDGEHQFWICDNGSGISAERQAWLFQPFHSLHKPDAARGLGLSIVQRLVDLQWGRCGYEPRSQGGSRFFFTLPVAENG